MEDSLTPFWRKSSVVETAREAALAIKERAKPMRELVADVLTEGPASPEQIQAKLAARGVDMIIQTVRARVNELKVLGRAVPTGERAPASSQRFRAAVWRVTDDAERTAILAAREGGQ